MQEKTSKRTNRRLIYNFVSQMMFQRDGGDPSIKDVGFIGKHTHSENSGALHSLCLKKTSTQPASLPRSSLKMSNIDRDYFKHLLLGGLFYKEKSKRISPFK